MKRNKSSKIVKVFVYFVVTLLLIGCGSDSDKGLVGISSSSKNYKGKDYNDVIRELEKLGFTNVNTEKIEDLIFGWLTKDGEVESVSIDGNTDYKSGSKHDPNAEIVIRYHTFPTKEDTLDNNGDGDLKKNETQIDTDKNETVVDLEKNEEIVEKKPEEELPLITNELLEEIFPKEMAKRAVVVAMTNYNAYDVYTDDGNWYDETKFHSYSDTSGNLSDYYVTVKSNGTWNAIDENIWSVKGLELNGIDGKMVIDTEISFDGLFYTLTNFIGKTDYNFNIEEEEKFIFDKDIFLIVPFEMVVEDRITEPNPTTSKSDEERKHNSWINMQFTIFSGEHTEVKKIIKKNLNDEKSYKHIKTTYYVVKDVDSQDNFNSLLASSGFNQRVEINDLWIETEFSYKNSYNATMKAIAISIASYANDTIEILEIYHPNN